ncbi:ABC transporter permease [Ulvibacterium marinum]|uniref:FtsX-like permease family protein n=1 Tax=Ulvibacterium marinum TaxID=2419782 RepID=A0A3B0C0R2_9FLAO|nr:ABC transporter permease [Ulvibacterium marinum]RKN77984.1 FtsX-like permease family protein [Ulvibacterium marinum]
MFKNYLKIAWRNLRRRKGFTIINILGLSLGFGCSILIFLFVSHHMSYDTFHKNSDRIYRVVTEMHQDKVEYISSVPPGFVNEFRTDYVYAEKVGKLVNDYNRVIDVETNTDKIKFKQNVVFAEKELFQIFNFPLVDGTNNIGLEEPNTALVTEEMANKMFGNENPVGKTFTIDGKEPIRITAILRDLPKTSQIKGDIFVSFKTLENYNKIMASETWAGINPTLQCYALLKPDQNISQIEDKFGQLVEKNRPNSNNVHHYKLQPLAEVHFNPDYGGDTNKKTLWTFSLIGLFLLIMACINFINIATAQSVHRSKEVGIRKVLGGNKKQLFWQFMAETFIISIAAFLIGLALSLLTLPYFNSIFDLELTHEGLLGVRFFMFSAFLLLLVAILSGSYPGVLIARILPILALKQKLSTTNTGSLNIRKTLVVVQFSISIVLIIATLVISKQIKYAVNSDLGFDKEAMVMVNLPGKLAPERKEGLKERISTLSGVEKITACASAPAASTWTWGTSMKYANRPEEEPFYVEAKIADEDYLATFDLDLVAGRNFILKDSIQEVLVNETLSKKLGLASPDELIGKKVKIAHIQANIVGVVADFHDQTFHGNINPIFMAPDPNWFYEFGIKVNMANKEKTLTEIEKLWSSVFPNYVFEYTFLDDKVAQSYKREKQFLALTNLFSILAIIIGCLGIYGLISFFVVQKTKEIGIRKVLGGSVRSILILITGDFLKLILVSGLIASPIAWYFLNDWLEGFAYRTQMSWWVFGIAIGGLLLITMITVSYQSIKAALANPVKSLRTE